jgi:hypothetical protein
MKKLKLLTAAIALLVYGCSEQMNPVDPATVPGPDSRRGGPETVTAPLETDFVPEFSAVGVAEFVTASRGGVVTLKGDYIQSDSLKKVKYDITIEFLPGALPHDETITISIDKATFTNDGTVTFGPCGLVFNTPAKLTLIADNTEFSKSVTSAILYYLVDGTMQPMPDSWGASVKKDDRRFIGTADVPHFSRYAFGR